MTTEERKKQLKSYLGKTVTVKIDRPAGYVHKKEKYTLIYPINYGYIPGVLGGDGEELDVYIMGVAGPIDEFTGRIIGIIHRENDVEDKLVAAPDGMVFNQTEIAEAVRFQEQYYKTRVECLRRKSCGYIDTGSQQRINEKLTLLDAEKPTNGIFPIREVSLFSAIDVIRRSFATVACEFGLTRDNCPMHTSFMTIESLQAQISRGWQMFGLYYAGKMVGYVSISKESEDAYELHNLAVLPEYRHSGCGKLLLDYTKEKVRELCGHRITIGIIEENTLLKNWYTANEFVHIGTRKFDHLPFTVGFMEWRDEV